MNTIIFKNKKETVHSALWQKYYDLYKSYEQSDEDAEMAASIRESSIMEATEVASINQELNHRKEDSYCLYAMNSKIELYFFPKGNNKGSVLGVIPLELAQHYHYNGIVEFEHTSKHLLESLDML